MLPVQITSTVNLWDDLEQIATEMVFTGRRSARIASALLATAIPSVCPSVRLSVRHMLLLCQNDGTQHVAVCTVG